MYRVRPGGESGVEEEMTRERCVFGGGGLTTPVLPSLVPHCRGMEKLNQRIFGGIWERLVA